MNKVKIIFCLFLLIISGIYITDKIKKLDITNMLLKDDKNILIETTLKNKLSSNKEEKKEIKKETKKEEKVEKNPTIYFFNTHQTEEYKSTNYNITPTVVTVSQMLEENLKEKGKSSVVETQSIKKGLDKNGYNYNMSYEISFGYLKEKVKKYKTLKYFFDIHRDSIKGEGARETINGKKYARIMFLIGENHENYKSNLKNAKIMEKYLTKNYPGILRDTYHQPRWSYNQEYSKNMFLIEVGGPDNTLEELYNTSKALSEAINYYVGGAYEK